MNYLSTQLHNRFQFNHQNVGKVSQIPMLIRKTNFVIFCFLNVEENVNPWCGRKDYFLVCKESLFLIKELMYFLSIKEYN